MRTLKLKQQTVAVEAPRELVFEVVASAGKTVGETDGAKLVEFETEWQQRVIKTTEEVRLDPPREIAYRWVEGPLEHVEERISFESHTDGSTLMTYSGEIGAGRGIAGWLRTAIVVRPVFNRLVREHLEEGKRLAERRARRSQLYRTDKGAG